MSRIKYYVMQRRGNFDERKYELVDAFADAKSANACVNKDDRRRERWTAIEFCEWKFKQAEPTSPRTS